MSLDAVNSAPFPPRPCWLLPSPTGLNESFVLAPPAVPTPGASCGLCPAPWPRRHMASDPGLSACLPRLQHQCSRLSGPPCGAGPGLPGRRSAMAQGCEPRHVRARRPRALGPCPTTCAPRGGRVTAGGDSGKRAVPASRSTACRPVARWGREEASACSAHTHGAARGHLSLPHPPLRFACPSLTQSRPFGLGRVWKPT